MPKRHKSEAKYQGAACNGTLGKINAFTCTQESELYVLFTYNNGVIEVHFFSLSPKDWISNLFAVSKAAFSLQIFSSAVQCEITVNYCIVPFFFFKACG